MGLKYGGKLVDDYSAMRGPCPEGFHVPLKTEWQGLNTIMSGLSLTTGNNRRINLHMPFAGRIRYDTMQEYARSQQGYYWSSSEYSSVSANVSFLYLTSSSVNPNNTNRRGDAFPIRGFKNTYSTPTSTWTVIQGTLGGAGIFWDQSEGLISITDGTTGYTIMDKNLGATAVYNKGDTLTQANIGNVYQRGNNYGFPSVDAISKSSSTQIDTSTNGPDNPYSSDTFITGNTDWSLTRNNNLRGGTTGIQQKPAPIVKRYYGGKLVSNYSAMRGPCPEGSHVPTTSELNTLYSYMNTLGLTNTGQNFKEKLLLPNSARLKASTGTKENVNYSNLRSCTSASNTSSGGIRIAQTSIYTGNNGTLSKSQGNSIRPFKDITVIPDSSWTTIYDGSSLATGAGIFHNSTLGLISLSGDGTNRLTIADKNLGATQVWNPGDTLTSANAGKYYQRGNNYGFDMTGATTTSSTKVDASAYGPGNYYSSDTFITDSSGSTIARDTTINNNLRGGVTGVQQRPAEIVKIYYGGKLVDDYSAMQGPCDTGFHVPMSSERESIQTKMGELGIVNNRGAGWRDNFKMPYPGNRALGTGEHIDQGGHGYYWTCTKYSNERNRLFSIYPSGAGVGQGRWADGFSIRPFKDTPVIPDSNWTTLYAGTGDAGIFHNSTLGLISISSDGTTWITIADKNLGATTVYNNGNTLSQDNCGNFYQRGNNYGFPFTGSITISSTLVDAGDYGPGNYYSSSTFITISTSPYNWSSVKNTNLRGGDTGIQQRPAEIRSAY